MIHNRRFYMIRHGETEANAARIMAGSLDSPLTQLGRKQAVDARRVLEMLPDKPTAIIHSQLARARETAEILNETLKLALSEDTDLAEMHAGDWEGAPYDSCRGLLEGWEDPPGGETFEQFFTRVKRAKNRALEAHDSPVLIVCHGGVFRAFAKIYGLDIWGVKNCHLHEFIPHEHDSFPWRVRCHDYNQRLITIESESYHAASAIDRKTRKA